MPRLPPSIDAEADRLETALKAARIPEKLHSGIWDVWVDDPARAHHLIARFKDYPPTPAVRYKAAAPGMTTVELPMELAAALAAARADEGDKTVIALLNTAARSKVTTGTRLSDDQKPATKSAPLRPWEGVGRATFPELYQSKGTKR